MFVNESFLFRQHRVIPRRLLSGRSAISDVDGFNWRRSLGSNRNVRRNLLFAYLGRLRRRWFRHAECFGERRIKGRRCEWFFRKAKRLSVNHRTRLI